jgi:hypothetical protein
MSVARVKGKLRIDVHLEDTRGNTLWEEPVEGDEDCAILIRRSALKVYIPTVLATSPSPAPASLAVPRAQPAAAPPATPPAVTPPPPPAPHALPLARGSKL